MRVIDAIVDLWENAGEPSDLNPWLPAANSYTDEPDGNLDWQSKGVRYYLMQLSKAQVAISNWKKHRGHEIRFKKFIVAGNIVIGNGNNEYVFTRVDDYTVSVNVADLPADLDRYDIFDNAAVRIGGKLFNVASSSLVGNVVQLWSYEPIVFEGATIEGELLLNSFYIRKGAATGDTFFAYVPRELVEILKV